MAKKPKDLNDIAFNLAPKVKFKDLSLSDQRDITVKAGLKGMSVSPSPNALVAKVSDIQGIMKQLVDNSESQAKQSATQKNVPTNPSKLSLSSEVVKDKKTGEIYEREMSGVRKSFVRTVDPKTKKIKVKEYYISSDTPTTEGKPYNKIQEEEKKRNEIPVDGLDQILATRPVIKNGQVVDVPAKGYRKDTEGNYLPKEEKLSKTEQKELASQTSGVVKKQQDDKNLENLLGTVKKIMSSPLVKSYGKKGAEVAIKTILSGGNLASGITGSKGMAEELMNVAPEIVPFNMAANASTKAQKSLNLVDILKSAVEGLPFTKVVSDVKNRGDKGVLGTILDRENITTPKHVAEPAELIDNVASSINPNYKPTENGFARVMENLIGGALIASPQAGMKKVGQINKAVNIERVKAELAKVEQAQSAKMFEVDSDMHSVATKYLDDEANKFGERVGQAVESQMAKTAKEKAFAGILGNEKGMARIAKDYEGMSKEELLSELEKLEGKPAAIKPKVKKVDPSKSLRNNGVVIPVKPEEQALVSKMTQALQEAKPVRKAQEALYTEAKGVKVGKAKEIAKGSSGRAGFEKELGELKGELPKVNYESIASRFSQPEIDKLYDIAKNHPNLDYFETITARKALTKMLGETGGQVPTEGELSILKKAFGDKFVDTLATKRPLLEKMKQVGIELGNGQKSLMASFDLSAPFRQGIFMISRPKQFFGAFGEMFKSFGSEESYKAMQQQIVNRKNYGLMKATKLALTDIDAPLMAREEQFMSNWAEKIPVVGKGVRASNRAYTTFLTKLRADVFDDLVGKAQLDKLDPQKAGVIANDLSDFINNATGRGDLGALNRHVPLLNSFFFSPRLMASRFNMLNPMYYAKLDPFVRKEALKTLAGTVGTLSTVLALSKGAGAEVELDPRSADFAKIKVGNTRYDIGGGFQQYIKLAAQLFSGSSKSSTTGEVTKFGEGYKPQTRLDTIAKFFEYKEAPVISLATNLLRGTDALGQPVDVKEQILQRYIPLVLQDMYDLYNEGGLESMPKGIPAIFGVGTLMYNTKDTKASTPKNKGFAPRKSK